MSTDLRRRIIQPNYDKPHRCPGWSGPRWRAGRRWDWCDGGYIEIGYERRGWSLRFNRCPKCGVIVLPIIVKWLDPTWYRYWRPDWWTNR